MNTEELEARVKALDYKELGHFEYRRQQAALEQQWKTQLERECFEHTISDRVCSTIWQTAWGEGHSEGYARVEAIYRDLAQLVSMAIEDTLEGM